MSTTIDGIDSALDAAREMILDGAVPEGMTDPPKCEHFGYIPFRAWKDEAYRGQISKRATAH
jgi:hypothetical protein